MGVRSLLLAALVAVALPTATSAKQTYAAYEGTDSIRTGTGGTKITKNGIDYWTSGTPPRRYQVLGLLIDARKDRVTDGNVLGSKSVAEKTIAAGGDAVLIGSADARMNGVAGNGNVANIITRTTTQLLVVKYLPAE